MAPNLNILSAFRNSGTARFIRFQSELLNHLSFSSLDLKNWRQRMRDILASAAAIAPVRVLFVFFRGEDEKFILEFLWCETPSPAMKQQAEQQVKQILADDAVFGRQQDVAILHTPGGEAPAGGEDAPLQFESRTFHITKPAESGIMGVGIRKRSRQHRSRQLAIDSVLTACTSIISSLKALSVYTKDVERFATRDALTNLYNQTSFWDLLDYETSRSRRQQYRFSILVIDLDNFKAVNDTYGHEAGDAFLKSFSVLFKNAVRSGDIAARYGGDQFAAILPVCDESQASMVARRLIDGLRDYSFTLEKGGSIRGTVSIGVAVFPDHAKDAKDLYLLAENMLSRAKSFGKDRFSMPSEQDDVSIMKSMGEKNILILEALAQRRFIPYFQPIMNVRDQQIEAYEVLTRIVLPDRVIPASDFIETAETMGAIGKIDYQLFELALAKVRESRFSGTLFINLSPQALILNEFMPTIRRMLRDYGLDPNKLIFEITERDTVKNMALIEKFIHELKQEGFRFAIDDFGSGYSSFQYIKTFSIDYLKIDGEFIRHMAGDRSVEKQIVSSIASLASHLGIKTIAEYVESQAILNEVAAAGINYAQGYFIQKPSPDLF